MKTFAADLHLHTALSPCGEDDMTPNAIVRQAVQQGLHIIAICDHNTAGNVAAVQEAAGSDLTVIAGVEITTAEEVHVVGLFPNAENACRAASQVLASLPDRTAESTVFGEQSLMDSTGRIIGLEPKLLSVASRFALSEAVALIHDHHGLAVAAHVDRHTFSVFSQLGFLPDDACFDALEVSVNAIRQNRMAEFSTYGLPLVTGSDSHFPEEIGICRTIFTMQEPTFSEMALAFQRIEGRDCAVTQQRRAENKRVSQ